MVDRGSGLLQQVKLLCPAKVDRADLHGKGVSAGRPQGSAFGLALLIIFINKPDENAEGTFTSFVKLMVAAQLRGSRENTKDDRAKT